MLCIETELNPMPAEPFGISLIDEKNCAIDPQKVRLTTLLTAIPCHALQQEVFFSESTFTSSYRRETLHSFWKMTIEFSKGIKILETQFERAS